MSNNRSNNNPSNTRNVYRSITVGRTSNIDNDEMDILLQQTGHSQPQQVNCSETAIIIEHDTAPGTSQQHIQRQQRLQQLHSGAGTTRINMEASLPNSNAPNNDSANINERRRFPNILSILREARHQLNRTHSLRESNPIVATANGENLPHPRTWRENFYDVLALPVTPRGDVLRAFFTPALTTNIRYNSLPTNDVLPVEQFNFLFNRRGADQSEVDMQSPFRNQHHAATSSSSALRLSRQNSHLTNGNTSIAPHPQTAADLLIENNANNGDSDSSRHSNSTSSTNGGGDRDPLLDVIDISDTNPVEEFVPELLKHLVRYLPLVFILFVKFIHDHLLGILDILLLHCVLYQLNKTLKEQIAKRNQKSYAVLIRDMILVICVLSYRFILSTSKPDPFGLLINPPGATITLDLSVTEKQSPSNDLTSDGLTSYLNPFTNSKQKIVDVPSTKSPINSTISVTKTISLGTLLYYVAVNDLILKLLTQLIKIIVTMLPAKVLRHKSRARLYALIEYTSHVYRALVPMRIWLTFLFESYTGLEVISGILFSAFYIGAKGFEFVEHGKHLKKALVNFIRNMDYDRKPTKEELEAAGAVCPICQDSYTTPVVLECSHIFCEECVNTWFKREQTCPMCRAKVSEDQTWQDGATTYFYQLC